MVRYHVGMITLSLNNIVAQTQNDVFFVLMLVESLLEISGVGFVAYLDDMWVWIDVMSIVGSGVGYFVAETVFIRAFRLVRILRVINNVPALRQMLETLTTSMIQVRSLPVCSCVRVRFLVGG